jgi:anti-sigma factor RsiW
MTNQPTDFTDSDLSAWLDGEGSADERARIEAHLRSDERAAAKVRLWSADRDALRARFDPVRSAGVACSDKAGRRRRPLLACSLPAASSARR